MGWCHEFGPQIREGCGHPMRAGESACVCPQCGVLCSGRFAGCAEVWARGPREVHVVSPPTTLARRTAVPAQAQRRAPEGAGAEQARNEVLAWLQAAFDGLRDELRVLAGGLARQQVALSDLAATRDDDVAEALAEVKGWASELRSETLRLQGFEKAVAERLRDEMTTTIHAGVDRIAVAAKGDEVRDALASVEERAAELREETTRLHEFGAALADQVRTEVARTVQQEIGSLGESAQAAPPIADALAETIRVAIGEALQQVQQSAPTGAPAPDGPPTLPVEEVPVPANEPVAEAESVAEGPPPADTPDDVAIPRRRSGRRATAGERPAVPVTLELPSGSVVGATLATAAVDALTLARVTRRRRRLPAPPAPGLHRSDPLLTDMLRRLERFALGRRAAAASGRVRGSEATRWGIDALPVAASNDAEVAVDVRELNGLALVGPGAEDAARAIAVTFFSRHRPPAQVVVVGGDLLRGTADVPGLARAGNTAAALTAVGFSEEEPDVTAPAGRQLVIAVGLPADALALFRQTVDQHPQLGVAVVSVGGHDREQAVAVVDVDADGVTRAVEPSTWEERLSDVTFFSLNSAEAAEVVALVDVSRREGEHLLAPELNGEVCHVSDWVSATAGRETPVIEVRMLGPFVIDVNGEEVRGGLRTKARELLAFYLLHPEGASLDAAVEALWPEADPGRGSEWFWTALGNLRSRLRSATGVRDLKIVDRAGDTYRIEVERFGVDVWRFETALAGGAVESALGLYGGELLAGDTWQWVEGAREDLRRRAVDAVAHVADARIEADDLEAALAALDQGLEIDAISEELYRRAMELQSRLARRDAVRGTFRLLQARLAAYGLTADPRTEQAFGRLVAAGS